MEMRRVNLPRPPRVPPALQEFPAVVEPALRDIDDPPETTIEGFELVESQPVALPAVPRGCVRRRPRPKPHG